MNSRTLISQLKIKTAYGNFPDTVTDITTDSREAGPASVFVALRGHQVDGYSFIPQAIEAGCRFIVTDRYIELPEDAGLLIVKDPSKVASLFSGYIYDFPHDSQTMIGVTGTNGKTTVATMIHNLSRSLGKNSAYLGTNGFMINEDRYDSINTTPETTKLHKRLQEANDGVTYVLKIEVSSNTLKLGRTFGIEYDSGIFTNLTQEQLDFHITMDEYGYVKGLLFSQMGQDVRDRKYIVQNNDDE